MVRATRSSSKAPRHIIGVSPPSWIESYVTEMQRGGVPYGRIINNTIVGLGGRLESNNLYNEFDYQDVGILIEDNADPTLLNNLIVNFEEGIATDLSSTTRRAGRNALPRERGSIRRISTRATFRWSSIRHAPMFVDRERGIFYPAAGSRAIDSALDSLEDRPGFVTIKDPLGISPSPILRPPLMCWANCGWMIPASNPPAASARTCSRTVGPSTESISPGRVRSWSNRRTTTAAGTG